MAREGMTDLIAQLRAEVAAGTADYSIGSTYYWTDDQLQVELDYTRKEYYQASMTYESQTLAGTLDVKNYDLHVKNLEDLPQFTLYDSSWETVGTADYTLDALNGKITFAQDTGGSAYYWTGNTYDINKAASRVWGKKAAHFAGKVNWRTDNHQVDQSQLQAQALVMKAQFDNMSGFQFMDVRNDTFDS